MILKNWHYFLFFISLFAIASALIAEYIFDLQPCDLCLKQRHPYYIIFTILICILFISSKYKIWFFVLIQLAIIYGLFYSIWHVGVENKFISGPSGCKAGLEKSLNTQSLKDQILSKQVISCDEVVWSFFGISAASLNSIVLVFIFIVNALYIIKNYGSQKKEYL
tara:strand:- start:140 stop:634 length:495 start_codon:yes stop_codon:yes gene_type:complete